MISLYNYYTVLEIEQSLHPKEGNILHIGISYESFNAVLFLLYLNTKGKTPKLQKCIQAKNDHDLLPLHRNYYYYYYIFSHIIVASQKGFLDYVRKTFDRKSFNEVSGT